eukprot:2317855-Rhodomonas_salina.2
MNSCATRRQRRQCSRRSRSSGETSPPAAHRGTSSRQTPATSCHGSCSSLACVAGSCPRRRRKGPDVPPVSRMFRPTTRGACTKASSCTRRHHVCVMSRARHGTASRRVYSTRSVVPRPMESAS